MEINAGKDLRENNLLSHIVLHGLAHAVNKSMVSEIADSCKTDDGVIFELRVLVNDEDINIESFIKHWEGQVDRMIADAAKSMIRDRFSDFSELLFDLEERIKPEINKRLEEWERN